MATNLNRHTNANGFLLDRDSDCLLFLYTFMIKYQNAGMARKGKIGETGVSWYP